MTLGTRLEVWKRKATHTAGGLVRRDLMKNKHNKIVSRTVHRQQSNKSNLGDHLKPRRARRSTRLAKKGVFFKLPY